MLPAAVAVAVAACVALPGATAERFSVGDAVRPVPPRPSPSAPCPCRATDVASPAQVPTYVNKVGPYFNKHETYHYYSLPVCRPQKVRRGGGRGE